MVWVRHVHRSAAAVSVNPVTLDISAAAGDSTTAELPGVGPVAVVGSIIGTAYIPDLAVRLGDIAPGGLRPNPASGGYGDSAPSERFEFLSVLADQIAELDPIL